jgi:CHASE3 domain sensor protein
MQTTIRTTIRIRKELLDQSRMIALERGTNLQEVINDVLARGFSKITDLNHHKQAMDTIDSIRQKLRHIKSIDTKALLEENKKVLQDRI